MVPSFTYIWYLQVSYPVGDTIPLGLTLTSENRIALDLLAVSHVIDVQLHKVINYGTQAAALRPLTLRDRNSYFQSDLAAKAHWQRDGHTQELPPDDEHPRSRWRIKLDGILHREANMELTPSFEDSGMTILVRAIGLSLVQPYVDRFASVVPCEPIPIPVDRFPARERPE